MATKSKKAAKKARRKSRRLLARARRKKQTRMQRRMTESSFMGPAGANLRQQRQAQFVAQRIRPDPFFTPLSATYAPNVMNSMAYQREERAERKLAAARVIDLSKVKDEPPGDKASRAPKARARVTGVTIKQEQRTEAARMAKQQEEAAFAAAAREAEAESARIAKEEEAAALPRQRLSPAKQTPRGSIQPVQRRSLGLRRARSAVGPAVTVPATPNQDRIVGTTIAIDGQLRQAYTTLIDTRAAAGDRQAAKFLERSPEGQKNYAESVVPSGYSPPDGGTGKRDDRGRFAAPGKQSARAQGVRQGIALMTNKATRLAKVLEFNARGAGAAAT